MTKKKIVTVIPHCLTMQSGIFGVGCSKNESDSIRMKIGK